ncbi:hypothetical protein PVAG01_02652 [Phlyctema vagabunda]|uniref:FAD-binding domain-containing protein n=1 Tax=Phlyctema vagabunda TaxID=108571 RepID=A0ABR4PRF0_9HELO
MDSMLSAANGTRKPVVIIGSGCTGLAIANGLKKAGVPVVVCEKSPALHVKGERDWNMGVHWGFPILKSLMPESSAALLQTVHVDPNTPVNAVDKLSFLNGSTGDLMTAVEIPYFYRLRRSKLRALLAHDLDIRWNKTLKDIVYADDEGGGATAIFEDGEHIEGCLIIGADGARSQVRRLLVGPEKSINTRIPYVSIFIQAKYTREQALFLRSFHPLYLSAPHPEGLVTFFGLQDAPELDKPEDWTFFFTISWQSSLATQDEEMKTLGVRDRLQQARERGVRFCEPFKSAYAWLPEDQLAWYIKLAVWDPSNPDHQWDNRGGRVTLAGDAAHPMTFQRGQGLNHAIADCGELVKNFTMLGASQEQAIGTYEDSMKERAGEEVRSSVLNTTMLHDWQQVLNSPLMKHGLQAKS